MNLQVESRLQLLLTRDITPVQHFTTLIGYVRDEYLLIRIPFEHGKPLHLYEGERLTLRVFTGTKACSFDATVTRVCMHPYFYAHLSFPRVVRAANLRMAMRVKVDIPATLTRGQPGGPAIPVRLNSLSITGALVESGEEIGKDDEVVRLSFSLLIQPGAQHLSFETEAKIRNTGMRKAAEHAPGVHLCGLQFLQLDPTHQLALQNLTYEALLGDRHKLV